MNANGATEPEIAHRTPTHGFPLPAFAGTDPAGLSYKRVSHVCARSPDARLVKRTRYHYDPEGCV